MPILDHLVIADRSRDRGNALPSTRAKPWHTFGVRRQGEYAGTRQLLRDLIGRDRARTFDAGADPSSCARACVSAIAPSRRRPDAHPEPGSQR